MLPRPVMDAVERAALYEEMMTSYNVMHQEEIA
ncbi:hypothetical protein PI124_g18170 [Phytophthora idaei]|nr:hypothetical protein PI126_g17544 [Phytophthora idaei]KAG3236823.1 hypothetical protein PI124_g18170 [Phytophthora idaei]